MEKPTVVGSEGDLYEVEYRPILGGELHRYKIRRQHDGEERFDCWEATTQMTDGIGNVTAIDQERGVCSVEAVMRGSQCKLDNVRILDARISRVHERVMVSEHVRLDGAMELVATKERILQGNRNFFKFGWMDGQRRRTVKVDIFTGEFREMEEGPIPREVKRNG